MVFHIYPIFEFYHIQGLQALSGKSKLPILQTKNSPIFDILDSFWPWDVRNFAHLNGFDKITVFHTDFIKVKNWVLLVKLRKWIIKTQNMTFEHFVMTLKVKSTNGISFLVNVIQFWWKGPSG